METPRYSLAGTTRTGCRAACRGHRTFSEADDISDLSLWLIGTVRAEPETVIISRACVQSSDPAE